MTVSQTRTLVSRAELLERRSIGHYECMITDNYVGTSMGRLVATADCAFDTKLPQDDDSEVGRG